MKNIWLAIFSDLPDSKGKRFYYIAAFLLICFFLFFLLWYLKPWYVESGLYDERAEFDPRRVSRVDYSDYKRFETSSSRDNFVIYTQENNSVIHMRNERDLSYNTLDVREIVDFSVFGSKSIVMDNSCLYLSDEFLFNKKKILGLNGNKGPDLLSTHVFSYGSFIYTEENGLLFRYEKNLHFWENVSDKFELPSFSKIVFLPEKIACFYSNGFLLFDPIQNSIFSYNISNPSDITFFNGKYYLLNSLSEIYELSGNSYRIFFKPSAMKGNKILGIRTDGVDKLYVLSETALNRYDSASHAWSSVLFKDKLPVDFYMYGGYKIVIFKDGLSFYNESLTELFTSDIPVDKVYFDGNKIFIKNNDGIFSADPIKKLKIELLSPSGSFMSLDLNKLSDVFYYNDMIIMLCGGKAGVYNIKEKKYVVWGDDSSKTIFSSGFLYVSNEKNITKINIRSGLKKVVYTGAVKDFDIENNKLIVLDNYGVLYDGSESYFDKSYPFLFSSVIRACVRDNLAYVITNNGYGVINLLNYKINSYNKFDSGIINIIEKDGNKCFIITSNSVYLFNNCIREDIDGNEKFVLDKGCKIERKYGDSIKISVLNNIKYLTYDGRIIDYDKPVKFPFNMKTDVEKTFTDGKLIYIILKTGKIYKFNPLEKHLTESGLTTGRYIKNIKLYDDKFFIQTDNVIATLPDESVIDDDIKDFDIINHKIVAVKNDNYLFYSGKKYFYDEGKSPGNQITSALINDKIIIYSTGGITEYDYEKYSRRKHDISIDKVVKTDNGALISNITGVYEFDANTFNLTLLNAWDNKVSSSSDSFVYKDDDRYKKITSSGVETVINFNNSSIRYLSDKKIHKIFTINGNLIFIGEDFAIYYSVGTMRWGSVIDVQYDDIRYIDNLIYLVKNNQVSILTETGLVYPESETGLPDELRTFSSYAGYFGAKKKENIIRVLQNGEAKYVLTEKGLYLMKDKPVRLPFNLKIKDIRSMGDSILIHTQKGNFILNKKGVIEKTSVEGYTCNLSTQTMTPGKEVVMIGNEELKYSLFSIGKDYMGLFNTYEYAEDKDNKYLLMDYGILRINPKTGFMIHYGKYNDMEVLNGVIIIDGNKTFNNDNVVTLNDNELEKLKEKSYVSAPLIGLKIKGVYCSSTINLITEDGIYSFDENMKNHTFQAISKVEKAEKEISGTYLHIGGKIYNAEKPGITTLSDPETAVEIYPQLKNIYSTKPGIFLESINQFGIDPYMPEYMKNMEYINGIEYGFAGNRMYKLGENIKKYILPDAIDTIYTDGGMCIVKTVKGYYVEDSGKISDYRPLKAESGYNCIEINEKGYTTSKAKTPGLVYYGTMIESFNDIKPYMIYIKNSKSYHISEKGLFETQTGVLKDKNHPVWKKRLNYEIITGDKNEPVIYSGIEIKNGKTEEKRTNVKGTLRISETELKEIMHEGIFDFDRVINFGAWNDKLYLSDGKRIWIKGNLPEIFNTQWNKEFYIYKGKLYEKSESQPVPDELKSSTENAVIADEKYKFRMIKKSPQIIDETGERIMTSGIFDFDLAKSLISETGLYTITVKGICGKDGLTAKGNYGKEWVFGTESVIYDGKHIKTRNGREIEEIYPTYKTQDSRWIWEIDIKNINFAPIKGKKSRRTYKEGKFYDDIFVNVYNDETTCYVKTKDNKIIEYTKEGDFIGIKEYRGEVMNDANIEYGKTIKITSWKNTYEIDPKEKTKIKVKKNERQ